MIVKKTVTSVTSETDDDESETNYANVNNYLDSANMATNLETAMKIAEEEDLWIGGQWSLKPHDGKCRACVQQEIDNWIA